MDLGVELAWRARPQRFENEAVPTPYPLAQAEARHQGRLRRLLLRGNWAGQAP